MKRYWLYVISALFLMACAEKKVEATDLGVHTSEEIKTAVAFASERVPIYNFDELQSKFLQPQNDTTYVVNFWATWCKPCVKELPAFEELKNTYADKKVKVVLVSLDFPEQLEKRVIPFIDKRGVTSDVVLLDDPNANKWIPQVSDEWSGAIPATVMVNSKRKGFFERSFTFAELEKELKSIL